MKVKEFIAERKFVAALAALIAVSGIVVSVSIFFLILNLGKKETQLKLDQVMNNFVTVLDANLHIYLEILQETGYLYMVLDNVTRNDFYNFVNTSVLRYPEIKAISWIPAVAHKERVLYENMAIKDGFPGFKFTKRSDSGEMIAVENKPKYFPVYYVQPFAGNESALGFDLSSNPERLRAIRESSETGKILATSPIELVQDKDNRHGFLVFVPIYSKTETTGSKSLKGFITGVFRIDNIVNDVLKSAMNYYSKVIIRISDITDPSEKLVIYSGNLDLTNSEFMYERVLEPAGRKWRICGYTLPGHTFGQNLFIPYSILISGLLVTALLVLYIISRDSELRLTRKKGQTIVDTVISGIVMIDARGTVELFNPAAEKLFGYAASEVIGNNVKMLMPEPYHTEHDGYLNNYVTTGRKKIIGIGREVRGRRKAGTTFPMELAVSEIRDADIKRFVGVITDISDRKEKEEQLSEQLNLAKFRAELGVLLASNEPLRTMLQKTMEVIVGYLGVSFARTWTISETDNMLILQASAGLYTHIDGGHARIPVGKFKIGLIAQSAMPHLTNSVQTDPLISNPQWAIQEGMTAFAGYPLIAEGTVIGVVAAFSKHPLNQYAIESLGAVAYNMAIAIKNKLAEEHLVKAKEEAEEANRIKSEFLDVMSHELRTPLTVMLGNIPLLKDIDSLPESDEIVEIAEDIEDSGKHLLALINDLLDFSKIEAEKMHLNRYALNISEVVEDSVSSIRKIATAKSLLIDTEVENIEIYGDRIRIRQILYNLLGNAVKFTDKGKITVAVTNKNGLAYISVSDTGIGMKEKDLPVIFDKFRQVDGSVTRAAGGTGLGLAITKSLVEMHGGTIEVKSEYQKGSVFTFTIPLYRGDYG
ncbi:MAG: CHASE domain-containing protein [Nitrospirae bacterium YQR-1]